MGTSIEGALQLSVPSYPRGLILGDVSQPTQSIYEESATQQYHLGTPLVYSDGRKFRYARNGGTALSKALMTTSEPLYARATEETQSTYGTSAAVGDTEIYIDVTTGGRWPADEYAYGF
jgi:hypothetical protein